MTYTTIQGQTWDTVAYEVYSDATKADKLMESNPEYLDIFVFPAGIKLCAPELIKAESNLPPWRKMT